METDKTNDNKNKIPGIDFGCKPEDFKGMFEMMAECFKAQDSVPDCSAMMKTMMANCCKIKNTKR